MVQIFSNVNRRHTNKTDVLQEIFLTLESVYNFGELLCMCGCEMDLKDNVDTVTKPQFVCSLPEVH
jgi:hypothetical protein